MDKKNILIIDDEKQILDLLQLFVEENGCDAVTEESAEKGLAMIRKQEFDMVLLDINLPDGDGLSVLQGIKNISPQIPVIMITGGTDIEIAEKCLENGAVDYIAKPFDFEYLKTSIFVNILGF